MAEFEFFSCLEILSQINCDFVHPDCYCFDSAADVPLSLPPPSFPLSDRSINLKHQVPSLISIIFPSNGAHFPQF